MGSLLPYIAAPWILWVTVSKSIHRKQKKTESQVIKMFACNVAIGLWLRGWTFMLATGFLSSWNQTWQSKIPYKWWIGGFSISYWTMISTDHEISNAWKQCSICVDGLICFEVANLIWKTLSPNIRRSRRQQRECEFECPCWKCTCFLRYYIIYIIIDLGFQMIDLLCLSHTWDEVWDGWTPSTDVFSLIESEASSMPTCWSRLLVPRLAIHEKCADHAWRGQRIKWTLFKWS